MDDIYGDLDNYNDQHIIAELKDENKELKCKLDEYATTLDTLRKDFDKLSSEYKKLELNYSSLLKTARAEIERKTKIITDLNKEKDTLVINSLQSRGKRAPNIPHGKYNSGKTKQIEKTFPQDASCEKELHTNVQKRTENNKVNLLERKNAQDKLSSSTSSRCSTGQQKSNDQVQEQNNTDQENNKFCNSKRTEGKESTTEVLQNEKLKSTSNVKRIMHRRKSMPALHRPNVIYSSDEEHDSNTPGDDKVKKKLDEDLDRKKALDKHEPPNSGIRDRKNIDQNYERNNSKDERGRKNYDRKHESGHTRDSWDRKNKEQKREPSNPSRRIDSRIRNLDQKHETANARDDSGRQNTDQKHETRNPRSDRGRKNSDHKPENTHPRNDFGKQNTDMKYEISNPRGDRSRRNSDNKHETANPKNNSGRQNTDQKCKTSNLRGDRSRKNSDQKHEITNSKDDLGRQNTSQKREPSNPRDDGFRHNSDQKHEISNSKDDLGRQNTGQKREPSNPRGDGCRHNSDQKHEITNSKDDLDRQNTGQKREPSNPRGDGCRHNSYQKYEITDSKDDLGRQNAGQRREPSNPRGDWIRHNFDQKHETVPRDDWGRQNMDKIHQSVDFRDYQDRNKTEQTCSSNNPTDVRSSRKLDDRHDFDYSKYDRGRKKSPLKDPVDRKHYDRDRSDGDRNGSKVSNTSNMDNQHFSYHNSKDMYHQGRSGRNPESERDSYKDTRQLGVRAKSQYNPGRYCYPLHNDMSGDRDPRTDYIPHRVLESPPPNSYTQIRRNLDIERHRFQEQEKYAHNIKHKLQTTVEEPPHKRIRTDSQNRGSNESGIIHHVQTHTVPIFMPPPEFDDFSCQSPDYEFNPSLHPVKEIMYTAATKLEDPRLKSKKYILRNENNKDVLSTIHGRNVEFKRVNKCTWGIPQDKLPTPLREKPFHVSDDFVKEIYMEIDNPISNLSLESGEIQWSDDDGATINTKLVRNQTCHRIHDSKPEHQERNEINIKHVPILDSMSKYSVTQPILSTDTSNKYGCSKIKKPDKSNITEIRSEGTHHRESHTITQPPLMDSKQNMSFHNEVHRCRKTSTDHQKIDRNENVSQKYPIDPMSQFSNLSESSKSNKIDDEPAQLRRETHLIVKLPLLPKDTVEGDLELSDETSDCMDIPDQPNDISQREGSDKEKHADNLDLFKETIMGDKEKQSHLNKFQHQIPNHNQYGVSREQLKCIEKNKECPKLSRETKYNKDVNNKSINEVEGTEPKSDTKNKFCDLFGDSNSLITPDDLGLTNKNQILDDCEPIHEDTQAGLDLNLKEFTKVQTRSSKIKNNETEIKYESKDGKHDKKNKSKDTNGTNVETKKKSKRPSSGSVFDKLDKKIPCEEPNVVKTVIISTGVQNNCPIDSESCKDQNKLTIVHKDIGPCQALSRIEALATSTPHKVSEPDISSSLDISRTKVTSNSSTKIDDIHKKEASNTDMPDMRIFVKRRRKTRASMTTHN